jgi:peptidoglycan/LPS O-acetylase OafA/YrhL
VHDAAVALPTRSVSRDLGFRADLEGLRGLAVLLVVLFHARLLGVVGGFVGVDAFYVLSGFLISGLLLRELGASGRLDLVAFYGRRARRILPPATVAIVVILIFAVFIVAPLDLPLITADATASGLFVGNIAFALRATDYFGSATPSPFLHYWSLGVEEQFYLVWPVLLVVAWRIRRLHSVTFTVFAGSLVFAIALTSSQAPWAFYGFPTRAWQLALGALLAMHGPLLGRLPAVPVAIGGWLGIGLLGIAAFALQPAAGYPGFAALLPTSGVGLVILASGRRGGPGRVLAIAPLRLLGRISFSLYLYHWPVFVLAAVVVGSLTPALSWVLVGLSVLIAIASWRLIEEPFRNGRVGLSAPGRSLVFAASTVCAVVLVAQGVGLIGTSTIATSEAARKIDLGAAPSLSALPTPANAASEDLRGPTGVVSVPAILSAAAPVPVATPRVVPTLALALRELRPRLADARYDGDGLNERGCGLSLAGSQPPLCQLGVADANVSVALVGDSHAAQWFPALEVIAHERGWRLLPFTKDSCIFLDMRIASLHLEREYTECALWREQVVLALQRARPDLVVVASSRWVHPVLAADTDVQRQTAAMVRLLTRLPGRLAIIADTPLNVEDIPACLSRADRTASDCSTPRAYALTGHLTRDGAAADALGATLIDPTVWLCGPAVCPAIIDWTIVYRDDHHLTATMVRRLVPLLEHGLLVALVTGAPTSAPGG